MKLRGISTPDLTQVRYVKINSKPLYSVLTSFLQVNSHWLMAAIAGCLPLSNWKQPGAVLSPSIRSIHTPYIQGCRWRRDTESQADNRVLNCSSKPQD